MGFTVLIALDYNAHTAGLFTKSSVNVQSADGTFYSNGEQIGVQLLGVVVAVTWSLLWTYLLTWLTRLTVSIFPSFLREHVSFYGSVFFFRIGNFCEFRGHVLAVILTMRLCNKALKKHVFSHASLCTGVSVRGRLHEPGWLG